MIISYTDLSAVFSYDLENTGCIEIEFHVLGSEKYTCCWMGKMPDEGIGECYWLGLIPGGSEGYDYPCFADMVSAPVFDGKCLKDILHSIDIHTINDAAPEIRLQYYVNHWGAKI